MCFPYIQFKNLILLFNQFEQNYLRTVKEITVIL